MKKIKEFIRTITFFTKIIFYGAVKVYPVIKRMEELEKNNKKQEEITLATKTVQDWSKYCIKQTKCNMTVTGLEKIPTDRPVLFVPNHQSYGDIPVLLHALRDFQFGFVVRNTMANLPFIKLIFKHFNCVSIDTADIRQSASAISQTAENIKNGYSMLIFPEGRRNFTNIPEPFKNGAFKIANKTGVTIVPIYLHNVHRLFEANGHLLGRPDISVNILEPIDTENMTRSDVNILNEKVHEMLLNYAKSIKE